jgi:hypothetical protein
VHSIFPIMVSESHVLDDTEFVLEIMWTPHRPLGYPHLFALCYRVFLSHTTCQRKGKDGDRLRTCGLEAERIQFANFLAEV